MFRSVMLSFALVLAAAGPGPMLLQATTLRPELASRAQAVAPAGWTFAVTALPGTGAPADSIACSSDGLCVARNAGGRSVYVSHNPSGGAGAWRQIAVPAGEGPASPNGWRWPLTAVSCPSTHFCAVLAAGGRIDTSGAPAKRASWSSHTIDPAHTLTAVSCPSTRLCVAGDDAGNVVVAANPAGVRSTWRLTARPGSPGIEGISCPSVTLCLATDARGNVVVARNPGGVGAAWKSYAAGTHGPLSCPASTFCIAGNGTFSTDPARDQGPWESALQGTMYTNLGAASCPSTRFCAAAAVTHCDCPAQSSASQIFTSDNLTAPPWIEAWSANPPGHPNSPSSTIIGISCPSNVFCAAVDSSGRVLVGIYPPGPPAAPLAGMTGLSPGRVYAGATVTFWAAAHGNPEPSVRWQEAPSGTVRWTSLANGRQRDGSYVSGASLPTLTITNTQPVANDRTYRAVYRNSFGTAVTKSLLLRMRSLPAGPFIAVTSGFGSACALRPSKTIVCWGSNSNGQAVPPAGRFSEISENWATVCGLRVGGTIACWGDAAPSPRGGQSSQAPPPGTFRQVSTGTGFACGIRTAGTLACWISDARRLDGAFADALIRPPSGQFTSVSAGSEVACGIRRNGTLACWGNRIDSGGAATRTPNGRFVGVSVGSTTACAVRSGGVLACWGLYPVGPVPPGRFSQVSVRTFACGIRKGGVAECWWSNGQQGLIPPPNRFRTVSAGRDFACGIKTGGELLCWGAVI